MTEYQVINHRDVFKAMGKKINFKNGWVHAHPHEPDVRVNTFKITLYAEERAEIMSLWEEVKAWLAEQNAVHTILFGRHKGGTQPYCLAWEGAKENALPPN